MHVMCDGVVNSECDECDGVVSVTVSECDECDAVVRGSVME